MSRPFSPIWRTGHCVTRRTVNLTRGTSEPFRIKIRRTQDGFPLIRTVVGASLWVHHPVELGTLDLHGGGVVTLGFCSGKFLVLCGSHGH